MKNKHTALRIIIGILSIGYIVFMWIKKDILSIYSAIPHEEAFPLIITTIVVSVFKVLILTCVILLVKWIIKKLK